MDVVVEVCRAFALTLSERKTETMCMPSPRTPRALVRVEAAGQIYKQVQYFAYLETLDKVEHIETEKSR